jgi:hypothetical protein
MTPILLTYNPCTPWLSVPSQILTLDPRWGSCVPNMRGLHDPPTTLTPGNGFFALTTPNPIPADPTKTNIASAAPAIPQVTASRTAAPVVQPQSPPNPPARDPLTVPNTPQAPDPQIQPLPAVATIGKTTVTANAASAFVIGDQTLEAGRQITYAGTVLSLATDGRALNIGGTTTQALDPSYLIGTQTLVAGSQPLTVSGTVMSLKSGWGTVVIGGSVTEDMSAWLGSDSTASNRGSGAHDGTSSALDPQSTDPPGLGGSVLISSSRRIEGNFGVLWLAVAIAFVGMRATM